jgi:hypothetical protein
MASSFFNSNICSPSVLTKYWQLCTILAASACKICMRLAYKLYLSDRQLNANCTRVAASHRQHGNLHAILLSINTMHGQTKSHKMVPLQYQNLKFNNYLSYLNTQSLGSHPFIYLEESELFPMVLNLLKSAPLKCLYYIKNHVPSLGECRHNAW